MAASAASSVLFSPRALSIAPPAQAPAAPPKRRRIGQKPIALRPAYYCVTCCVCARLGPIAPSRERGEHPPRKSGWRFLTVHAVGGWWCWRCMRARRRLMPPRTRAGCADGPRPCKRILCQYHLAYDVSRKAPSDFELPISCTLDVVDANPDGMTLREVGAVLGMSREGSREIILIAAEKLRRGAGVDLRAELLGEDG